MKPSAASLYAKHARIAEEIGGGLFVRGADRDDLRQEARLALWEACRAYDPSRGPFPNFARKCVKNHLVDLVRVATRRGNGPLLVEFVDEHAAPEPAPSLARLIEAFRGLTDLERVALVQLLNGEKQTEQTQNALFRARRKLRAAA